MYSCLAKPGLGQGLTRFSNILYILNILSILSKKWDFLYYQVSLKFNQDLPMRALTS